jgi:hypothetical protein
VNVDVIISENVQVDTIVSTSLSVVASLNGLLVTSLCPPIVEYDSLDGGQPSDITYAPINSEGIVGISGGMP